MSTGSLPFVSADRTISKDLLLPDSLREELAKPIGPIISSHEVAGYIRGCGRIYSVGDMVTTSLLEVGIEPDIMIFDFKTQRGPCDADTIRRLHMADGGTIKVENPPGRLTAELWNAIAKSSKSNKSMKIEVKGEEDMASLACIEIADIGDCVIYGIPDEGISAIRIDDEVKKIVRAILLKMTSSS